MDKLIPYFDAQFANKTRLVQVCSALATHGMDLHTLFSIALESSEADLLALQDELKEIIPEFFDRRKIMQVVRNLRASKPTPVKYLEERVCFEEVKTDLDIHSAKASLLKARAENKQLMTIMMRQNFGVDVSAVAEDRCLKTLYSIVCQLPGQSKAKEVVQNAKFLRNAMAHDSFSDDYTPQHYLHDWDVCMQLRALLEKETKDKELAGLFYHLGFEKTAILNIADAFDIKEGSVASKQVLEPVQKESQAPRCMYRFRCREAQKCKFTHSEVEKAFFADAHFTTLDSRSKSKVIQCRHGASCVRGAGHCPYAHTENDMYCRVCTKWGHLATALHTCDHCEK